MNQKEQFLQSEGDAYFHRNRGRATDLHDRIAAALQALNIRPRTILEIGCGDGAPGTLVVADFLSKVPCRNPYARRPSVSCYK